MDSLIGSHLLFQRTTTGLDQLTGVVLHDVGRITSVDLVQIELEVPLESSLHTNDPLEYYC